MSVEATPSGNRIHSTRIEFENRFLTLECSERRPHEVCLFDPAHYSDIDPTNVDATCNTLVGCIWPMRGGQSDGVSEWVRENEPSMALCAEVWQRAAMLSARVWSATDGE